MKNLKIYKKSNDYKNGYKIGFLSATIILVIISTIPKLIDNLPKHKPNIYSYSHSIFDKCKEEDVFKIGDGCYHKKITKS